jgi:hypothetical protein
MVRARIKSWHQIWNLQRQARPADLVFSSVIDPRLRMASNQPQLHARKLPNPAKRRHFLPRSIQQGRRVLHEYSTAEAMTQLTSMQYPICRSRLSLGTCQLLASNKRAYALHPSDGDASCAKRFKYITVYIEKKLLLKVVKKVVPLNFYNGLHGWSFYILLFFCGLVPSTTIPQKMATNFPET